MCWCRPRPGFLALVAQGARAQHSSIARRPRERFHSRSYTNDQHNTGQQAARKKHQRRASTRRKHHNGGSHHQAHTGQKNGAAVLPQRYSRTHCWQGSNPQVCRSKSEAHMQAACWLVCTSAEHIAERLACHDTARRLTRQPLPHSTPPQSCTPLLPPARHPATTPPNSCRHNACRMIPLRAATTPTCLLAARRHVHSSTRQSRTRWLSGCEPCRHSQPHEPAPAIPAGTPATYRRMYACRRFPCPCRTQGSAGDTKVCTSLTPSHQDCKETAPGKGQMHIMGRAHVHTSMGPSKKACSARQLAFIQPTQLPCLHLQSGQPVDTARQHSCAAPLLAPPNLTYTSSCTEAPLAKGHRASVLNLSHLQNTAASMHCSN